MLLRDLLFEYQPVTIPSTTGGVVERIADHDRVTMTVKAGQTVLGGRLVEITGDWEVQPAGAISQKVMGVALYDGAAGAKVTIATEGIYLLLASGAISAGDLLFADSAGRVKTIPAVDATNVGTLGTGATALRGLVGVALAAIADTFTGPVKLRV